MNTQRLEQIVAELMRPISDVRRNFDTDLSALLEEYLTEAGLHALDAEEEGVNTTIPNFAELALLLQQSASIYSRKVDFLYQHVLSVSESLHNSTAQEENRTSSTEEAQTPSRRRRRLSAHEEFSLIELEASACSRRELAPPRPPPTLPRIYVELEPRVLARCDVPLLDYAGEPVGLLADFHVTWRLQEGLLVEELVGGTAGEASLRALPLTELQAAIEAAAPPSPPLCLSPPSSPAPPADSTPEPTLSPTPPVPTPTPPAATSTPTTTPPPDKRERKRRSDLNLADMGGEILLSMSKKLRGLARAEFSIPARWRARVVRARKAAVLAARRRLLRERRGRPADFRGFDFVDSMDIGGFIGWSTSEIVEATLAAEAALQTARRLDESDDDGFFDQSSLGDSDASRHDECAAAAPTPLLAARVSSSDEQGEWAARAAAGAARGADVPGAARRLLRAAARLPPPCAADRLLADALGAHEVPEMFLATLFLANAGNVEIIQGPPLTMNTFSIRVLSTDERLYRAAAAADEQLLR